MHGSELCSVLNDPISHKTQGPPAGSEKPLLHTQSLSAMFKAPPEELVRHARHAVAFVYGLYSAPKHGIHSSEDKSKKVPGAHEPEAGKKRQHSTSANSIIGEHSCTLTGACRTMGLRPVNWRCRRKAA